MDAWVSQCMYVCVSVCVCGSSWKLLCVIHQLQKDSQMLLTLYTTHTRLLCCLAHVYVCVSGVSGWLGGWAMVFLWWFTGSYLRSSCGASKRYIYYVRRAMNTSDLSFLTCLFALSPCVGLCVCMFVLGEGNTWVNECVCPNWTTHIWTEWLIYGHHQLGSAA